MTFRKYIGPDEHDIFMGAIRSMSFHLDNFCNKFNIPIFAMKRKFAEGEVMVHRFNDIDTEIVRTNVYKVGGLIFLYRTNRLPAGPGPTGKGYVFNMNGAMLKDIILYSPLDDGWTQAEKDDFVADCIARGFVYEDGTTYDWFDYYLARHYYPPCYINNGDKFGFDIVYLDGGLSVNEQTDIGMRCDWSGQPLYTARLRKVTYSDGRTVYRWWVSHNSGANEYAIIMVEYNRFWYNDTALPQVGDTFPPPGLMDNYFVNQTQYLHIYKVNKSGDVYTYEHINTLINELDDYHQTRIDSVAMMDDFFYAHKSEWDMEYTGTRDIDKLWHNFSTKITVDSGKQTIEKYDYKGVLLAKSDKITMPVECIPLSRYTTPFYYAILKASENYITYHNAWKLYDAFWDSDLKYILNETYPVALPDIYYPPFGVIKEKIYCGLRVEAFGGGLEGYDNMVDETTIGEDKIKLSRTIHCRNWILLSPGDYETDQLWPGIVLAEM